jgi:putative ABC transport system substrate-binding protein
MRRREFVTLLGGAVGAWPLAAGAQQTERVRRIGFLVPGNSGSDALRVLLGEFRQGLREFGWIEGRNVGIEYRFAEGKQDLLPALAVELVRSGVELIVAEGTPATQALKSATRTIPVVMATSGDPVRSGFVASLARPGGNITGLTLLAPDLSAKRLQLLKEIVPSLSRVALLSNAANPASRFTLEDTQAAARALGVEFHSLQVRAPDDFADAFVAIGGTGAHALLTASDGMFFNQRARIAELAGRHGLPALFPEKEFVQAGGLISYGPSPQANFRRAAAYVDKILKGALPSDLPVEQPIRFELAINLKTSKAIGLDVPPTLLAIADEVIERRPD